MLAANNTLDFRTISDFRKDNLVALSELFLQVLTLCQRAGRSVIACWSAHRRNYGAGSARANMPPEVG